MSTKQQFQQARHHIQAGEYAKARAILQRIDHPTAKAWLAKLPADRSRTIPSVVWWIVLTAIVFAGLGYGGGYYMGRESVEREVIQAFGDAFDATPDPTAAAERMLLEGSREAIEATYAAVELTAGARETEAAATATALNRSN